MKNNNLFFHSGERPMENQQIVLNGERTVYVVDGDSEFAVENVKKIEIKSAEQNKIKIKLGPQVNFVSTNKKIVVNEILDKIIIEMLNDEEQLSKCISLISDQEARGLIDYIREYAPDLYTLEALLLKSLEELRQLKESMDDLANCY